VAKLSQACEQAETRCQFTLEDQDVMIVFSGSKIGALECERVPKRTVLAIIVKFSRPKNLQEYKITHKQFKVFDASSPPKRGNKTYYYVEYWVQPSVSRTQTLNLRLQPSNELLGYSQLSASPDAPPTFRECVKSKRIPHTGSVGMVQILPTTSRTTTARAQRAGGIRRICC
jgi:hypothetical protein